MTTLCWNGYITTKIETFLEIFVSVLRAACDHPKNVFWHQLASPKRHFSNSFLEVRYQECSRLNK